MHGLAIRERHDRWYCNCIVGEWWLTVVDVAGKHKKSGKRAIMSLVLPTYVADILQDFFFFVEIFSVRTSILCRHFISKSSIFLLRFG